MHCRQRHFTSLKMIQESFMPYDFLQAASLTVKQVQVQSCLFYTFHTTPHSPAVLPANSCVCAVPFSISGHFNSSGPCTLSQFAMHLTNDCFCPFKLSFQWFIMITCQSYLQCLSHTHTHAHFYVYIVAQSSSCSEHTRVSHSLILNLMGIFLPFLPSQVQFSQSHVHRRP